MRSLFAHVFVSVWIVLGVVIAGCIATTTMVAWHRISVLSEINFEQMNKDANTVLQKRGEGGLKFWLRNVGSNYPGIDIYLLNPAGRDILNRNVPDRLAQWLARGNGQGLISGAPGQSPLAPSFQFSASHLLESSQIAGAHGTNYTLAVAWFGSSPIDVLGSYDVVPALLILAVLVSAIVSWWLARYISAPIRGLQHSARILARGNLDTKVESRFSRRRDEIGTLARDFNHMASELKSQIQAKEVLLRDVSHELRSPLARIQIALGLAGLEKANIDIQHRRIERDIERMDVLIQEIIQLTRLTGVPQSFRFERLDLSQLLDSVVEDVALEAKPRGQRISLIRPAGMLVLGHPEMLRRAVENVLRNAVRYSPNDAQISISVAPGPDGIAITVRDEGPGVPEAEIKRIFDPFYRVSVARDRDSGGTGLGLAITARVMLLHNGQVTARNDPEGGGLVVTLFVPAGMVATNEFADTAILPLTLHSVGSGVPSTLKA
jgi:two-component system OmpR family sensor kinase